MASLLKKIQADAGFPVNEIKNRPDVTSERLLIFKRLCPGWNILYNNPGSSYILVSTHEKKGGLR